MQFSGPVNEGKQSSFYDIKYMTYLHKNHSGPPRVPQLPSALPPPPTSPHDSLVVSSASICPPPPPTSHDDSLDGFPASICPSTTTNKSSRLVGSSSTSICPPPPPMSPRNSFIV